MGAAATAAERKAINGRETALLDEVVAKETEVTERKTALARAEEEVRVAEAEEKRKAEEDAKKKLELELPLEAGLIGTKGERAPKSKGKSREVIVVSSGLRRSPPTLMT